MPLFSLLTSAHDMHILLTYHPPFWDTYHHCLLDMYRHHHEQHFQHKAFEASALECASHIHSGSSKEFQLGAKCLVACTLPICHHSLLSVPSHWLCIFDFHMCLSYSLAVKWAIKNIDNHVTWISLISHIYRKAFKLLITFLVIGIPELLNSI